MGRFRDRDGRIERWRDKEMERQEKWEIWRWRDGRNEEGNFCFVNLGKVRSTKCGLGSVSFKLLCCV